MTNEKSYKTGIENMMIKMLGKERPLDSDINRIEFKQDGVLYTITPEKPEGFRIHRNDGERITLYPCVRNEIVVR